MKNKRERERMAFANVASTFTSSSLINISIFRWIIFGLRVKWYKQPLAIPIKGVTFPSDLSSVRSWPNDRCTTRHLRYQTGSRLELRGERSGDITPRCRFKRRFRKSYRLSSLYYCMSVDLAQAMYHAAFAQAFGKPRGLGRTEWV